MNLESDRLILREFSWKDLPNIHRLQSYPEIDEFNTLGIPKSFDDTKDQIRPVIQDQKSQKRRIFGWVIYENKNEKFIGLAGMTLSIERFKMAEIYFNITPQNWGYGFATEVVKTIIKFGFEKLKLHRIEAGVSTENSRSINVLEKVGMIREGLRRKILPIRGKWKDNYHYAILEDDVRDY